MPSMFSSCRYSISVCENRSYPGPGNGVARVCLRGRCQNQCCRDGGDGGDENLGLLCHASCPLARSLVGGLYREAILSQRLQGLSAIVHRGKENPKLSIQFPCSIGTVTIKPLGRINLRVIAGPVLADQYRV